MTQKQFKIASRLFCLTGILLSACSSKHPVYANTNGLEKKISNSVGMAFVYIPPGTFLRGSPLREPGRKNDEHQHPVKLTSGFYMQTTEVTQGQWKAVMGIPPLYLRKCNDACPVERVSWDDAQEFIRKLNSIEGSQKYRLPTEAQWEYAARAGSMTAFANGDLSELDCDNDPNLNQLGWYCGNSRSYPHHRVGRKHPNAWGLYDMHGSVWEWCSDWYGDYPLEAVTDPVGPPAGTERVLRGGGLADAPGSCRSANRFSFWTDIRFDYIGFRLVRSP